MILKFQPLMKHSCKDCLHGSVQIQMIQFLIYSKVSGFLNNERTFRGLMAEMSKWCNHERRMTPQPPHPLL